MAPISAKSVVVQRRNRDDNAEVMIKVQHEKRGMKRELRRDAM